MSKFLFLIYDNRSGSTYLSALLNQYSQIYVSEELDIIYHLLENKRKFIDPSYIEKFKKFIIKNSREEEKIELYIDLINSYKIVNKDYVSFFNHVLNSVINTKTKSEIVIIKSPRTFYHINDLISINRNFRFLHIIRDGRAVFSSKKNSISVSGKKMDTNPINAARIWKKKLKIADKNSEVIYTIQYEDLINSPDIIISRFCSAYLNITYLIKTEQLSEYQKRIPLAQKHLHDNIGKNPKIVNIDKWKNNLTKNEIFTFELINKKFLKKHGYILTFSTFINYRIFSFIFFFGKLIFQKTLTLFTTKNLFLKIKRKVLEIKAKQLHA